jgi:hypothetical protein
VVGVRFLLCGGRLKVEVVEMGDEKWEVFVFVRGGVNGVLDILRKEGFVQLFAGDVIKSEKVMSKVVEGNVIDYCTELSVKVAEEMKKWSWV